MFSYASEICIEKAQSDQRASDDANILIVACRCKKEIIGYLEVTICLSGTKYQIVA
jgi:hypothetical protein